jgi:hypothetical protein
LQILFVLKLFYTKLDVCEEILNYRTLTILIVTLAVSTHLIIRSKSSRKIDNYVYIGQLNLKKHLSNNENLNEDKIIFLGSSAVSGSNIPKGTTITDYFNQQNPGFQTYNLAVLQSNLLDANIMLNIFKDKHPKIAVLGIDPSIMIQDQSSLFSKYYSDKADPVLKQQMKKFLSVNLKDRIDFYLHTEPLIPTYLQVQWKSFLLQMRFNFWGNLFNKKMYGEERSLLADINSESNNAWELIDLFVSNARMNNIQPVIFLEPIMQSTYQPEEFAKFVAKLETKSQKLGFPFFNYSNSLPNTHDYFFDYVHLSPVGHQKIASLLTKDIVNAKIIKSRNN